MINKSDLASLRKLVSSVVAAKQLEVTQKLVLDVHANLVIASPVDKGEFRAAWDVQTPTKPFEDGVIENNKEYAQALAKGHSPQAPEGWVENAIEAATRL